MRDRPVTTGRQLRNGVRERRTALTRTQAELADAVGVTRQTIIAIERGGYAPSVVLALLLAEALATPVQELFWLEPSRGGPR